MFLSKRLCGAAKYPFGLQCRDECNGLGWPLKKTGPRDRNLRKYPIMLLRLVPHQVGGARLCNVLKQTPTPEPRCLLNVKHGRSLTSPLTSHLSPVISHQSSVITSSHSAFQSVYTPSPRPLLPSTLLAHVNHRDHKLDQIPASHLPRRAMPNDFKTTRLLLMKVVDNKMHFCGGVTDLCLPPDQQGDSQIIVIRANPRRVTVGRLLLPF